MRTLIALALLLLVSAPARAEPPRDMLLLAWSQSGAHALVRESVRDPAGGALVSYRVVGPGVMQTRHEISNTRVVGDGRPLQRISKKACREALLELKKSLVATKFRGVTLQGDECAERRGEVVLVSPELARQAEQAEVLDDGEALVRDELRIRVEPERLVLEGPTASRRLRLPRRVDREASHVLLSPQRRLLLLLVSARSGEQVLAAGFSSKTGEIPDFQ